MNSTIRTRAFLILLALTVGLLSFYWDQVGVVFAQDPSSPLTPTPFGLPPAPPPLPGLTPTATPDLRVVNQIIQPKIGDAVFGNTPIVGTALLDDYLRYEVHISPSGAENWQWLVSSFAIVRNGLLYVLDTTKYPDGFYDLRVRAIDAKGGYTESFVRGDGDPQCQPTDTHAVFCRTGTDAASLAAADAGAQHSDPHTNAAVPQQLRQRSRHLRSAERRYSARSRCPSMGR